MSLEQVVKMLTLAVADPKDEGAIMRCRREGYGLFRLTDEPTAAAAKAELEYNICQIKENCIKSFQTIAHEKFFCGDVSAMGLVHTHYSWEIRKLAAELMRKVMETEHIICSMEGFLYYGKGCRYYAMNRIFNRLFEPKYDGYWRCFYCAYQSCPSNGGFFIQVNGELLFQAMSAGSLLVIDTRRVLYKIKSPDPQRVDHIQRVTDSFCFLPVSFVRGDQLVARHVTQRISTIEAYRATSQDPAVAAKKPVFSLLCKYYENTYLKPRAYVTPDQVVSHGLRFSSILDNNRGGLSWYLLDEDIKRLVEGVTSRKR